MAAVAFDESYPYDGGDAIEAAWREMFRALGSGVVSGLDNELQVVVDTGRNIGLHTGRAWAAGEFGKITSAKTGIAVATNSSGNPRIDRLVMRNNFTANQIEFEVKTGTPGLTPAAPALVSNGSMQEFSLARIGPLASGFTNVAGGDIHDERCFLSLYSDAAYADTDARDLWVPSPKTGFVGAVRDTGGLYLYDGTTWRQQRRQHGQVSFTPAGNEDTASNATWPSGVTFSQAVPAWATRARILGLVSQVFAITGTTNVDVQVQLGSVVAAEKPHIRWDNTKVTTDTKQDLTFLDDVSVASIAGTTVTVRILANVLSGSGAIRANTESACFLGVEFR